MSDSKSNPWTTKKSETIYENPWIHVVKNDVINPNGGDGEYTVVHFRNRAVSAVPIDEHGYTWLVGQYRYTMDSFEWEVPEGGGPMNEEALESAKRELQEETGLIANRWDMLFSDVQLSNSVTDELAYGFVARDLTQCEAAPDETELLQVKRLPFEEAIEMIYRNEIRDGFSILSLLQAQHLLRSER